MPLLNYTTKVAAVRSVGQVQELLIRAGASSIMARYDEGRPIGLTFAVKTQYGERSFSLPVLADRVTKVLMHDREVPRGLKTSAQGERVAWRILKDWVEAQLAIIATEMVTLDQVMLPYMQADDDGRTVYELYRTQQLALEAGPS